MDFPWKRLRRIDRKTCARWWRDSDKVLVAALVLSLFTLGYKLGAIPPGLNQDEASTAYDAYAILHYGIDRIGFPFPVVLVSWGSGMYVLASYIAMPFIWLFGLSVFSARLGHAVIGLLDIAMIYYFIKAIADRPTARIAALLAAISPWHIMMARWGLDSNVLPSFFLAGALAAVHARTYPRLLILSAFLFGLSLYAYGTAYVAVPMFLLLCLLYGLAHKAWPARTTACAAGVFLVTSLPVALFVIINKLQLSSIVTPFFSIPRLTGVPRFETMGNFNVLGAEFYRNAWENVKNAFGLLSSQFDGLPWNGIPEYGLLYLFSLPLAALGAGVLLERTIRKGYHASFFLLAWCIACLVLAAFVSVNINRFNIAMLPFIFCAAFGLSALRERRWVFWPIVAAYSLSFLSFIGTYFGGYSQNVAPSFFASFGDAIRDADASTQGPICVTDHVNMPYIFVLFYTKEDPRVFRDTVRYDNPGAEFQGVSQYGRYRFGLNRCKDGSDVLIAAQDEAGAFDDAEFIKRAYPLYTVLVRRVPRT
jgi:4-amino-4-deoxy-L-arabinose transferase-like glycosyltransferase